MTVQKLINYLQTLDPDMLVVCSPYDGGTYYDMESTFDFMEVIRTEDGSYRDTVDDGTFRLVTKNTPDVITVLWL